MLQNTTVIRQLTRLSKNKEKGCISLADGYPLCDLINVKHKLILGPNLQCIHRDCRLLSKEIATLLLAHGLVRCPIHGFVAPSRLKARLSAQPRFIDSGLLRGGGDAKLKLSLTGFNE